MIPLFVLFTFLCLCIYIMFPFITIFHWLQSLLMFYLIICINVLPSFQLHDYFNSCFRYRFSSIFFQYLLDHIFNPNIDYHTLDEDY